jgi:3'-5' exonuclease
MVYNFPLQKTMFIDVETVSYKKDYEQLDDNLKYLWQKKSNLLFKEDTNYAATYKRGAAIYAEFGKIVCVCLGYFIDQDCKEFKVKKFTGHDEVALLKDVFAVFDKFFRDNTFALAGHNVKEFDVPYICRRALINRVKLPFFFDDLQNRKPWDSPIVDTLHLWRFGDYKHFVSLELLAAVLHIPTPKDDIDGSMVGDVYWNDNDVDRIAFYCSKDVLTVAQVVLYLNNYNLLDEKNVSFL